MFTIFAFKSLQNDLPTDEFIKMRLNFIYRFFWFLKLAPCIDIFKFVKYIKPTQLS